MAKLNLFDHLVNLTTEKTEFDPNNDEQAKSYNPYMINRFISMDETYIPIVNEVNKYDLPKDVHYNFWKAVLPQRRHYFKYMKNKKEWDSDVKDKISRYFECGTNDVDNHLRVLTEEQVNSIISIYRD